jgi:adenosylcobinamide-GDP ribazoletransferase
LTARAEPLTSRPWDGLAGAIRFLTIVPVPGAGAAPLSLGWFPLVGLGCGAAAGAVRLGGAALFGRVAGSVLALIVLVVITGALHQDGLADFADGLGVRGDRIRRLAAMRDSSTGAFGVLALIGWALLLVAALAPLSGARGLLALLVAGALSRSAILLQVAAIDPARADGLGAAVSAGPGSLLLGGGSAAAAALIAAGPLRGLLALGVAGAAAAAVALLASRTVGGRTGDTLGAAVALCEVAVCLALLASWR